MGASADRLRMIGPIAWRNIWRNPRRTVITLIVVAVGLYSILMFAALLRAWAQASLEHTLNTMTGHAQIHAPGYLDDPTVKRLFAAPDGPLAAALDGPEIAAWAPRLLVPAVLQSEYRTLPITLAGVDPARERRISTIPAMVDEGTYLPGPEAGGIVLGRKMVERLGTRLGKRVIVLTQHADGRLAERGFRVIGVFSGDGPTEENLAFASLATVQQMLGAEGRLAEIALRLSDDARLEPVLARLRAAAPELDIRDWKALSPLAAATSETMGVFVYIWLWVMFVLMAIGIVNTQLMAVFERVREFGLMQALGMRPRMILGIVTLESALLVGLGALIGIAGAALSLAALKDGVDISAFAEGLSLVGAGRILYPKADPAQMVELSLVVWSLGVLVALWPARRAARSSPVEAMTHVS